MNLVKFRRCKDRRPRDLVAAALELFVRKGYEATTLQEIAELAGVSKGTIYLYFQDKEALLKAVVIEGLVPQIAEAERISADKPCSAAERIVEIFDFWWRSIGSTPLGGLLKLMIAESRNFPELSRFYSQEVFLRVTRLLAGVIERGIDGGEFRPMNAEAAAQISMFPFVMRVVLKHSLACDEVEVCSDELYISEATDFVLRAMLRIPIS